uniref:prostaglandin E2 receptor EP2 subtype-like n=1 Tax=Myxine glutinosa TaxID=7769 RepID=UPI00358F7B01
MARFDQNSTFVDPAYGPTCSSIIFSVGVAGNLIALWLLLSTHKTNKCSPFYALVLGLTVTDLLGSCLTGPVALTAYAYNSTVVSFVGAGLCRYLSFMLLFFGLATLAILCAMALERYLSICHPYRYESVSRRVSTCAVIASIYLVSLAVCTLPLGGFGTVRMYEPGTWCYMDMKAHDALDTVYPVAYAAISAVFCLTIIFCNLSVMVSLLRMLGRRRTRSLFRARRSCDSWSGTQRSGHVSHEEELNTIAVLACITLLSLTCTIPLTIRMFINASPKSPNEERDLLALRLYTINPILDPWIYILLRKSLCRRLCYPGICHCQAIPLDHTGDLVSVEERGLNNMASPIEPTLDTHAS